MENQHILVGGDDNGTDKIAPTLLDAVSPDAPVMQEEIFGPILPILTYATLEEAIRFVKAREKPLALYLFTTDRTTESACCRKSRLAAAVSTTRWCTSPRRTWHLAASAKAGWGATMAKRASIRSAIIKAF